MKNYKILFNETYNEVFKKNKRDEIRKRILKSIIIFFAIILIVFIGFVVDTALAKDSNEIPIIDSISICLSSPILWFMSSGSSLALTLCIFSMMKMIHTHKFCEEKAEEFATTIYLDDIIKALSSQFLLPPKFKEQLKNEMRNFLWYDEGDKEFNDEFNEEAESDEGFFKEKMKLNDQEYYLIGWINGKTGFLFECKKIISYKEFQTVEFLLNSEN
jgi:hypothetical protein